MTSATMNGALRLVRHDDTHERRLALARRHIETAIAHINDAAQRHVPVSPAEDPTPLDELRSIVRALADIREGLCAAERTPLAADAGLPPSA